MISFAEQSIWIVKPTWIDDRGTMVPDLDNAESVIKVDYCSVQPGATAEIHQQSQGVIIRYSILAPSDVDVDAHDGVRLTADGTTYEIEGEPQQWPSPLGGLDHTAIYAVDRKG